MIDTNVQRAERWFAENCYRLSQSFPEVRFHLMQAADEVQGKLSIQVNGPVAGASITFWNKGDVEALALDKINDKNHTLDDRVLATRDDVSLLLQSYFEKLGAIVAGTGPREASGPTS